MMQHYQIEKAAEHLFARRPPFGVEAQFLPQLAFVGQHAALSGSGDFLRDDADLRHSLIVLEHETTTLGRVIRHPTALECVPNTDLGGGGKGSNLPALRTEPAPLRLKMPSATSYSPGSWLRGSSLTRSSPTVSTRAWSPPPSASGVASPSSAGAWRNRS